MTEVKLQLDGKIEELKGKLRQKYGELTDSDLEYQKGKEKEFLGRLEQKIGKSQMDLKKEISDLINL